MEKKDWKKELRELSFMKGYYFKLDDNGLVKKEDDQLVFNREELEHFIEQELSKAREEGREEIRQLLRDKIQGQEFLKENPKFYKGKKIETAGIATLTKF